MNSFSDSNLLLIGTLVSTISAIAFIGFAWGIIKSKVDAFRSELSQLWNWKDEHAKEADEKRQKFDGEIAALRIFNAAAGAQNNEVLRRLENIEKLLREELQKKTI